MHGCCRAGRAAGGREENGLSLSYRSENYGSAKQNTAEMRTKDVMYQFEVLFLFLN